MDLSSLIELLGEKTSITLAGLIIGTVIGVPLGTKVLTVLLALGGG